MISPLLLLFLAFSLLLLLAVPIAFTLGLSSLLVIVTQQIPATVLPQRVYSGLNSFTLLALAFFFLTGNIMSAGTAAERLVRLAMALVGHIRGGLALVTVVVGMFFGGVTGSSTAEAAGLGAIFIPAMRKRNYDERFAVAISAVSSTMGVIIPPSILMVVYGAATNVSIGRLLIGGILPGMLIAVFPCLESYIYARLHAYPAERERWLGVKGIGEGVRQAGWALALPGIIVGGMIGGLFTPTEASVVSVVYAIFASRFVYRDISTRRILDVLADTAIQMCPVLLLIATSSVFAWVLAFYRVPDTIATTFLSVTTHPLAILGLIIALYLILGTFLDAIPCILIFAPMLQPIARKVGIDELHLGLVIVMTCAIGLLTIPYGTCTLATCAVAKVPVVRVLGTVYWVMAANFTVIVIMVLFPGPFLWLPNLLIPIR